MVGGEVDAGREHKLAKAGPAASETHGEAESAAEEVLNDIHGWEVHQAKAETSE